MKKVYLSILASLAIFASCDPLVDGKSWDGEKVSASQLQNGIVLEQFDYNDETGEYTPADDGNYISFATNPSKVVEVYTIDADGIESVLSTGKANGMVEIRPGRGSEPDVTIYFRTREYDASSVVASKDIKVKVAQELQAGVGYLVSYAGQKVWKWDTSDGGAVWGNFGYTAGSGDAFADNRDGQWWGINTDGPSDDTAGLYGFDNQQQHRGDDKVTGDDSFEAYMVFYEAGNVKSFDKDGKEIRSAKFALVNYDPNNKKEINGQPWSIGQLQIKGDDGGILWPYAINTGGKKPTEYEIVRLTTEQLILTYAAEGTGSWSEATFWRFRSDSDQAGNIAGYNSTGENWTWDSSLTVWGNGGYHGGDFTATENAGQWWGINTDGPSDDTAGLYGFDNQQQHRGGDKVTGDDSFSAYMTFFPDGTIKSFDKNNKEIRNGKWSITKGIVNGQARNLLNTTAGSILWPYAINTGGYQPEKFELVYSTPTKMALVYAAEGTGDWSEATFWRFKKK